MMDKNFAFNVIKIKQLSTNGFLIKLNNYFYMKKYLEI